MKKCVFRSLFFAFLGIVLSQQAPLFAQSIDFLKEKILKNEVFLTDPFSPPFDSAGRWVGKEQVKNFEILAKIKQQKAKLESFVLELLAKKTEHREETMALAHLAAYLGYEKAHVLIWDCLIETSQMHGWEGPNYELVDTYLDEGQYPSQLYYWACLTGLNLRDPAQSMSLTQYKTVEKSLTIFLERYAHLTFLSSDPDFEKTAWHYVLMRKNDPKNPVLAQIEAKRKKRQVFGLVLCVDRNMEEAEKEQQKIYGKNPNLPSIWYWKIKIGNEIWYRSVIFFATYAEAQAQLPKFRLIRPKAFLAEFPCYPKRIIEGNEIVYACD